MSAPARQLVKRYEIALPTFDNDGQALQEEIDEVVAVFIEIAGGSTLVQGSGYWVDPQSRMRVDDLQWVIVDVQDATQALELEAYLPYVKKLFRQQELYVSVSDRELLQL